jgi:chemotaxis protein CheD
MGKVIEIKVAEYGVARQDVLFTSSGIGSCLVVCLYDEYTRIGSMAHCMLPERPALYAPSCRNGKDGKYVSDAIANMLEEIEAVGGARIRLKAKIVGGAEMFSVFSRNPNSPGIGQENIRVARQKLAALRIPIVAEEVGGSIGRAVNFNLENGILSVSIKM